MNGLDPGPDNFGDIGAGKTGQGSHPVINRRNFLHAVVQEDIVDQRGKYKIPDKYLNQQRGAADDFYIGDGGPFQGGIGR